LFVFSVSANASAPLPVIPFEFKKRFFRVSFVLSASAISLTPSSFILLEDKARSVKIRLL